MGKLCGGGLAAVGVLGGLAFVVASSISLANGSPNTTSTATVDASGAAGRAQYQSTSSGRASDLAGIGVGAGLLALGAAGVFWFVRAREGSLAFDAPETIRSGATPQPRLTPSGVALTF
jgi:hypothetical protein